MVAWAVRIITGKVGCWRWIASKSAMPSMPGIFKSLMTAAGRPTANAASAASPELAVRTV
jgi:hypothetical protein